MRCYCILYCQFLFKTDNTGGGGGFGENFYKKTLKLLFKKKKNKKNLDHLHGLKLFL